MRSAGGGGGVPSSARPAREWSGLGADVGGPGTRCRGALAGWVGGFCQVHKGSGAALVVGGR